MKTQKYSNSHQNSQSQSKSFKKLVLLQQGLELFKVINNSLPIKMINYGAATTT